MTTFTKIPESERPSIAVDTSRRLSPINKNIYGGFTEHMGRCIYGGIYDPGNPLSDERGFRKDVLAALRDLNIPVVRYPGGNFVATYHWIDGVGPRDQRPARPELAWLGVETNQFGTDEFLQWCEELGTEPYFALNFGTGTLEEALAWVEYCNSDLNTYYANLRRKNGREKPYKVKYWALGNEMWGPWQIGQLTKEEYARKAVQWAKALKLLDPSIILILCGETGYSSWDHYVLHEAIAYIDMHSIHIYTASPSHLPNVTAPLSASRAIEMAQALIDLARVEARIPPSVPRQTICFDEWNVWDPIRAPGELGGEEAYTLSDALAVAVWLNVFIRQSKFVGMANIAQTVNVISPLMTTKTSILKQTTWWPLMLFSKYMRGWTLGAHVRCGEYEGDTMPVWIRGIIETPWLDVSAVENEDGKNVALAVVNISEEKDIETDVAITGKGVEVAEVTVYTVTGKSVEAKNMEGKEEVGVQESKWKGDGKYVFPKLSLTMMLFPLAK